MQRFVISAVVTLLLCVIASMGASGTVEYKSLYQTIPDAPGVYLPIVIKQELPTPTVTVIPTMTPTRVATVTPTATVRPNCDASYPTVCIPPPPPDLDCKNIPYRRFKVLPPDPHNFDTDHDGIGCER